MSYLSSINLFQPAFWGRLFLVLGIIFPGNILNAQGGEAKNLKNGERLEAFGEFDLAIPYLENAISANPENPWSHFLLGKCFFLTEQKALALPHFAKAWELNPNSANGLALFYARTLHFNHDFDKAIEMYNRAKTNFKPEHPEHKSIVLSIQQCESGKNLVSNPLSFSIQSLGPVINSGYADHSPQIAKEGTLLIFTSRRPVNEKRKRYNDEDIFQSTLTDSGWSLPERLGPPINTAGQEASVCISASGDKLWIFKNPPGRGDLFESKANDSVWSVPVAFPFPLNTTSFESSITFSPDGNIAWFASDRPGGFGGMDIWQSNKQGDTAWSEPVNAGKSINSQFDEDGPVISPDGHTLYYSANRPECLGGYDFFKSDIHAGIWGPPQNLGYPLNTTDDDLYFSLSEDGNAAFFSGVRKGGFGKKDIYRWDMEGKPYQAPKPKIEVSPEIIQQTPPTPIAKIGTEDFGDSYCLYSGKLLDAILAEPLVGKITLRDSGTMEVLGEYSSDPKSGNFSFEMKPSINYRIEIYVPNYQLYAESYTFPANQGFKEINKEIMLNWIKTNESITLLGISFDSAKTSLSAESSQSLNRLLDFMNETRKTVIEISVYIDNSIDEKASQKLSEQRAKTIVQYLKKNGIASERLVAKGYGAKKVNLENESAQDLSKNNRTEIRILKN